jgi:hypothetical protein
MLRIVNISRQRIRIYAENGTLFDGYGWLGLNPGIHVDVEEESINEGWLYILEQNGIIKIEEI